MDLKDLEEILKEYPLNSFVATPRVISVNKEQIESEIAKTVSTATKNYLFSISDLIKHNNEFYSNNRTLFLNYISRLIGTTSALKELVQLTEDVSNIFENEYYWTRSLAIRGMITILDSILQELTIIKRKVIGSRFINRLREKVRLIFWEKIPKTINILSLMIAAESNEVTTDEVLSAIGSGIKIVKNC